ncbi:MAG TPA: exodeoxyribonuclease VII large subunit [Firmicutes bacterium]|nr:exodeoxyribonuclease VII large subunit [Bacillota bacterium]
MTLAFPIPALVYNVSEVTNLIKDRLESDPRLVGVWVRGEIGTCKFHTSGHLYFTLKDSATSLRCVMFRSFSQRLRFQPTSGLDVLAFGEVGVYGRDGNYQLYVRELEPAGLGALFLALEQTRQRLSREGLFDPERKRPLPRFPRRVGVITSPVGAALQDIFAVARRRFAGIEFLLAPVSVQGTNAPAEIVQAFELLNQEKALDVIILARGGGSKEDLWTFNDERVARAVAAAKVPVVSAVGHEVDYTLADLAADVRAPTPSAAAELVVPDARYLQQELLRCSARLGEAVRQQVQKKRQLFFHLAAAQPWQEPLALLRERYQALAYSHEGLRRAGRQFLSAKQARIQETRRAFTALNPLSVLERGFVLVMDAATEAPVTRAVQVLPGQSLKLKFADGTVVVRREILKEGK